MKHHHTHTYSLARIAELLLLLLFASGQIYAVALYAQRLRETTSGYANVDCIPIHTADINEGIGWDMMKVQEVSPEGCWVSDRRVASSLIHRKRINPNQPLRAFTPSPPIYIYAESTGDSIRIRTIQGTVLKNVGIYGLKEDVIDSVLNATFNHIVKDNHRVRWLVRFNSNTPFGDCITLYCSLPR
ncbi:MAG: hypothetical protein JNL32_09115 [Candidatus Kapabacteria bacterium]|nr:hypothetical protein [Candidatus Kapabacteria bacterium]